MSNPRLRQATYHIIWQEWVAFGSRFKANLKLNMSPNVPCVGCGLAASFFLSVLPCLSASFCLAFCLALFVVESTAVGTLEACVEASFVVGGGYANWEAWQFTSTCSRMLDL